MSGLTFTEIDQSIKNRRRLHLTLLKNGRTCARFVLRVVEYFRGKRDEGRGWPQHLEARNFALGGSG